MSRGEFQRVFLWAVWVTNLLVNVCYVLICWATAENLGRMSGNLHLPSSPGAAAGWSAVSESARAFVSNSIWRAPIAACAIGGLMAALFNVTSCLVLVRRSLLPPGASSFGLGFVTAWAAVLSLTTLLCGLVLEAFKTTVRDHVDPATATVAAAIVEDEGAAEGAAGVGVADGAGDAAAGMMMTAAAGAGGGAGAGAGAGGAGANAPAVAAAAGALGWTSTMTGAYAASYGFAYACTALYALFFLVLLVFKKAVARQISGAQRAAIEIGAVAAATGGSLPPPYSQASAI